MAEETTTEQIEDEVKRGARNSRNDQTRLQQIHDYAVENGAMCQRKSSYIPDNANALKTVSKTDEELRVANYIVLFGGRDLTSFSGRSITPNPDGSLGEFFSPQTDFESDYTKTGMLYVDFEHSQDPDDLGVGRDDVLGYVDWKTAKKDERGIFVERVLKRRQKYVEWLEELIDLGLIGNSTEAIPGKTARNKNGEIIKWALRRDTLTVNPMEPRMLAGNALQAAKALAEVMPEFKSLITPEAAIVDKSEAKATPIKTNKELEMDEATKALLDEVKTSLKQEIETAAKTAVEEVLDGLPEVKAARGTRVRVTEAPEDREFKSIGENAIAVKKHVKGEGTHPRIRGLQAKAIAAAKVAGDEQALEDAYKAALGSNEAVPSQGEFLLEPTITRDLIKPIHEDGVFSTKVRKLPVGPNSNSGWIPGVDETSRATGSRWGGVRGYHSAEAGSMTASQPKFRKINWELHKTYVLQYATDELLNDAGMLTAIINQSSAEELNFMVNDDLVNGVGGDRPVGVLQSSALVSVARAATGAISHADILNMWQRLHPRFRAGAEWYVNSEVETQLDALTFTSGSTGILSPYVRYDSSGVMNVKGRPVNVTEFNPALGTLGDILLANFDDYLMWEKGAIEAAMSIHVQFLTDQTAFRFIARYDGQTALASPITPYKGTNTQSPFVALLATT